MGENSDVFEPDSPDQSIKEGYPSPIQGSGYRGRSQLDSTMSDLDSTMSDLDSRMDTPPGFRSDGLRVVANGCRDGSKSPIKPLSNSYYEEPDQEDIIHKTILVGDSGVGKTSLLVQFDQAKFQSGSFSATVGIGFTNKVVTIDDAKVKLQIWDTAGQERFRSVTHAYYRDAHALLLLYDVTNKNSFDNTRAWLGEIHEYAQDDVVIMLIGNKADMPVDRQVRFEDGERLAKEYGVAFMETSAKTGINVDLSFLAVARELKYRKSHNPDDPKFNVTEYVRQESQRSSSGCCSSA